MQRFVRFFSAFLLPGFVFQNVIMAGGYGTGRELAEYFLALGPKSAILALLVTGGIWSLLCALTFEFARCFQAFDYHTFFKALLGRFWWIFEVTYWAIVLLVLAIIGAASGSIVELTLGWPYEAGVLALMGLIALVVYFHSKAIALMLSYWSFFLLLIYIAFFVICYALFSKNITAVMDSATLQPGWTHKGMQYGFYNLCFMPAVFFSLSALKTRTQAISAGLFAGFIAVVPAFFFILAMCSAYPSIIDATVPAAVLIHNIGSPLFGFVFYIGLFGTLVGTGVGMVHAINQRVGKAYEVRQKIMPRYVRSGIALLCFLVAFGISKFGLVALIDKGYGTLTWIMIGCYVLPLAFIGIYKIAKQKRLSTKSAPIL
tara:strand:+ start:59116 stop:60234 length:1119 start_codon:yes stop_codon:yes gene_type:complete